MKKLLSILAAVLTVNSFACWFTQENFNGNYIAGVNNYQSRYTETANLSQAIYTNDLPVAFPLTVWVKVTPLKYSPSGELLNTPAPLVKAVLPPDKAGREKAFSKVRQRAERMHLSERKIAYMLEFCAGSLRGLRKRLCR